MALKGDGCDRGGTSVLAERAASEGPRSTRAVEVAPSIPPRVDAREGKKYVRLTAAVGITLAVRPERATREELEKLKRCSVVVRSRDVARLTVLSRAEKIQIDSWADFQNGT